LAHRRWVRRWRDESTHADPPRRKAFSKLDEHTEGHRRRVRTANPFKRAIQREIKRRTRKIRVFPNEASLERLATAILVEIDEEWTSTTRTYINMKDPE